MKKILVLFICILIVGLCIMSYNAGKIHAIKSAEMFVVDLPDRNEYGGFDEDEITVYMVIDEQVYEYGCDIC